MRRLLLAGLLVLAATAALAQTYSGGGGGGVSGGMTTSATNSTATALQALATNAASAGLLLGGALSIQSPTQPGLIVGATGGVTPNTSGVWIEGHGLTVSTGNNNLPPSEDGGIHIGMPYAKDQASGGGYGKISIFSNNINSPEAYLQSYFQLYTDPTPTSRYFRFDVIEQNVGYRNILMNAGGGGTSGFVGICNGGSPAAGPTAVQPSYPLDIGCAAGGVSLNTAGAIQVQTGGVTAGDSFHSAGANAAYFFQDRTGATNWALYASGLVAGIFDGTANRLSVTQGGGVQVGAPTGGDKGAGAINAAAAYYANGTVGVTCNAGISAVTGRAINGLVTTC